ncbi:MAG: biotin--[acetyl-CoA-carboxylase] ligase [Balneolales bacterium]
MLQTDWLGRRLWYFRTLDSSNRYLHDLPGERLSHGLVCLTDYQTNGRGQFGRKWYSSANENLTFTIALKPERNDGLQLFSMAVMLALKETIEDMVSARCYIKWPNDLLYSGEKIAGILTECTYNGAKLDRILLGIGINVNQSRFPDSLAHPATSVSRVSGGQIADRPLFLAMLLNRLEPYIDQVEDGDMNLVYHINRIIDGYGEWVTLMVGGVREETLVKVLGVNEFGHLVVLAENGDVRTFTHQQVRIVYPTDH